MRCAEWPPEKWFLILAIPLGLALLLIIPPFQIEDEYGHFWRTYALSQGQILPEKDPAGGGCGVTVPESVVRIVYMKPHHGVGGYPNVKVRPAELLGLFGVPLEPQKQAFANCGAMAFYAPPPYLAPTLAIFAGRLLGLPPIALFYLGRAACLALWIALTFAAIRVTPFFRWGLALVALLPLMLTQAAGLTADNFLCAVAFLTIAWCLRLAFGPEPVATGRQIVILGVLCVLLALSKQAYFPLALLYLLVPVTRVGTRRRYWATFAAIAGAVGVALALWTDLTARLMQGWVPWADPHAQLRGVLAHPFGFVWMVLRTLKDEQSMTKLLGRPGWEDFMLPELLVWLHLSAIVLVTFADRDETVALRTRHRLIVATTFAAAILTLALALYMAWNPVGNLAVRGLQRGRYYLPLAPLPFLAVCGLRPRTAVWAPAVAGAASLWALWVVFHRYIAP